MEARLIIDGPRPPGFNMAADLYLLMEASQGRPALRLYQWSPPAVSLGRSQPLRDVNRDAARLLGAWIVRRPTGGRGIYHAPRDLTFALALPLSALPEGARGPVGAAVILASAVAEALGGLGVPARPRGPVAYQPRGAICVLAKGAGDILIGAWKVGAIAALVRGGAVLAHGTLIARMDYAAWASLFNATPAGAGALRATVAGLEDLGYRAPLHLLAPKLVDALSRALGARFSHEPWSPDELEVITEVEVWEWRP